MRKFGEICESLLAFEGTTVDQILGGRRALILAPHPDDESLGCGGLIAAACKIGLPPIVVIMTDGAASHPGSVTHPPEILRSVRESETHKAVAILGLPVENLVFLRYADTALPGSGAAFDEAVAKTHNIATQYNCELIFAPWQADPHCDHEAAALIGYEISRLGHWPILSYPVWGWLRNPEDEIDEPRTTGFRLNISAELDRKQNAIHVHVSQYGDLIKDSPSGFQLPTDLLNIFSRPFEIFLS